MAYDHRSSFWIRVTHSADKPPIPGQCHHVLPNGRSRCGQAISVKHGNGKWCWPHRTVKPDGTRGAGPRNTRRGKKMEPTEAREINLKVQRKKDQKVLTCLTDATHKISPCPDDGSVYHPYTELASAFRAEHKRWPLWWEMAKTIHDYETSD